VGGVVGEVVRSPLGEVCGGAKVIYNEEELKRREAGDTEKVVREKDGSGEDVA
jgi:hypothetical protein